MSGRAILNDSSIIPGPAKSIIPGPVPGSVDYLIKVKKSKPKQQKIKALSSAISICSLIHGDNVFYRDFIL